MTDQTNNTETLDALATNTSFSVLPGEGAVSLTCFFALPDEDVARVRELQAEEEQRGEPFSDQSPVREGFLDLMRIALDRGVLIAIPFATTAQANRNYDESQAGEAGVSFLRQTLESLAEDVVQQNPGVALRALAIDAGSLTDDPVE